MGEPRMEQPSLWLADPGPDPAPVDCEHLWRRLPDLRGWLTRAVRAELDYGQQWRTADPDALAARIATHIAAGILPVLDRHALVVAHQEHHRLGLFPPAGGGQDA